MSGKGGQETVVLAGGCFWGVQAVFQHVKGVITATSGHWGGSAKAAEYEVVSTGTTGHAESVKIVYDPSQITYGQLLKIFFSVAHNPTELNPSGAGRRHPVSFCDLLRQRQTEEHRSGVHCATGRQAKVFPSPIVTQVVALKAFYPAEAYHQNYATLHPNNPYIVYNDLPKVANLREQLPNIYRASISGNYRKSSRFGDILFERARLHAVPLRKTVK